MLCISFVFKIQKMILDLLNDFLWGYILIIALLACAVYFTLRTHFVQFRMIGETIRLLGDSSEDKRTRLESDNHRHVSSFQAFTISLASRVGTGNLAGVAAAIAVGGPGAVFWMWVIALIGASSAFIESTLAQLYKTKGENSFIGGPAYYMLHGMKCRWMGVLFAILITLTFGFAFNSVQSNTICEAMNQAFQWNNLYVGLALTILTLFIIFGGVHRIAVVSSVIVPIMALGYILLALYIVIAKIQILPEVLSMIVSHAMGFEQVIGGSVGAALMQGVKRGLFSNEAGMGSAPNAAATATVTHPVKQGLIQALGVFTDTLVICSCTAFIILFSGIPIDSSVQGIQLTQQALQAEIGSAGSIFVAVAILFFAFSSILGNYYYGEANILFITKQKWVLYTYRFLVTGFVLFGALSTLETAWSLADLMMALMTLCNLVAISILSPQAIVLLKDYIRQKKDGIKSPSFDKTIFEEKIRKNIPYWD